MFLGREVSRHQDYSESTARRIDIEVDRLLRKAYEHAESVIEEHEATIRLLADTLIEKETLDGRDAEDLIRFGRVRDSEERETAKVPESNPPDTESRPPDTEASADAGKAAQEGNAMS